jgi:hypothetical protein
MNRHLFIFSKGISKPVLRKTLVFLLILVALAGAVQALGLADLNFGDVEQGGTYTQTIVLVNSPQDIDNHFVVEVGGIMKGWITVSPVEFDLTRGSDQPLTVTLAVPKDATLGEGTATITAVGKKIVPSTGNVSEGASVGYAVATKSNVAANVVKPGATAAIEITNVETPKGIKPGDIVKFTITAKNVGNVPSTGQFSVAVTKGSSAIATIPGVPVDFGMNAEQTVKLYWDTGGQSEGTYTAVVSVAPSSSGRDVKIRTGTYPAITLELGTVIGQGASPPLNLPLPVLAGICIIIGIILAFIILRRRNRR